MGHFASFFSCFAPPFLLFAFRSFSRYGRHSCEKSKDFVVYFLTALIKQEIHMKCEKCIVSVSYFVVCFAKTLAKMIAKCKKRKVHSGVFRITFFAFWTPFSLFAFRNISHQSWHMCEKPKDFVVYFYTALIKHKIHIKYEKLMGVLYFVVCFAKTFVKYLRNAKYEKFIAGLRTKPEGWNVVTNIQ